MLGWILQSTWKAGFYHYFIQCEEGKPRGQVWHEFSQSTVVTGEDVNSGGGCQLTTHCKMFLCCCGYTCQTECIDGDDCGGYEVTLARNCKFIQ